MARKCERTHAEAVFSAVPLPAGVVRHARMAAVLALCAGAVLGPSVTALADDPPGSAGPVPAEGRSPGAGPEVDVAALLAEARSGNPAALYHLSLLSLAGKLGKPDGAQIERWLSAAYRGGHSDAGFVRATMFLKGFHLPADPGKAAGLMRELAERGHDGAQNALGQMYFDGAGLAQDHGEAARWFAAASKKGNAAAQSNLALMYVQGNGVAPDTARAFELMSAAARAGRAGAQHNLAWMYEHGVGVAVDEKSAADWYRRAAEGGESRAQYNIGLLYLRGKGVDANPVEAVKWLVLAASTARNADIKRKAQATLNGVTPALKSGDFHEGAQAARMWLLRRQWAQRSDGPESGPERR